MTSTISDGRGDRLSCRQVFAYHWEAADCAGMKLAVDQCLLFYGSLPGKGDQCGRGSPQWCCASTWVRWRSWGEHLGAQGCSIWKRNSEAIKHMGGRMATRHLPWENQWWQAYGLDKGWNHSCPCPMVHGALQCWVIIHLWTDSTSMMLLDYCDTTELRNMCLSAVTANRGLLLRSILYKNICVQWMFI